MMTEYDLRLYEVDVGDMLMYVPTLCELPRSLVQNAGLRLVKLFKDTPREEAGKALMVAMKNSHQPRAVITSEIEKILSKN